MGCVGDYGPATDASIYPWGIAVDNFGNIFCSDYGHNTIRKINASGTITTIVGVSGIAAYNGDNIDASTAELNRPNGITVDACGDLVIADGLNYRVRQVSYPHCNYLEVRNENPTAKPNIYPNPTNDILNINNLKTQSTYRLLNVVGSAIQQGALKEGDNSISVRSLLPGMYLLELVDGEGKRVVRKVVKE